VLVLDSADDVSQGATKGNSGIVHAGFDDTPGSVRSKFCWKGNQMFPQLDNELHFGYQVCLSQFTFCRQPINCPLVAEKWFSGSCQGAS
jgi:L-2-hydroxyglutarate oxidase LhgO